MLRYVIHITIFGGNMSIFSSLKFKLGASVSGIIFVSLAFMAFSLNDKADKYIGTVVNLYFDEIMIEAEK